MINPTERILQRAEETQKSLLLVRKHVRNATGSFWKTVGNPFLLSEATAERLTEIEAALDVVNRAIDAAQAQVVEDVQEVKSRS